MVRLKLMTDPMRDIVKVQPNAIANSLFLNQYAVMEFCAGEKKKREREGRKKKKNNVALSMKTKKVSVHV